MKLLKPIVFATIAIFSLTAQADIKAAYINSAKILQESPQAIAAVDKLKSEFSDRENAIRKLAKETQDKEANLKKDGAIMSAKQKKSIENEILEKKRKIRFDAQSLKEDVDLRRKQEIEKVRSAITSVIQAYAKKKGYDFVFTQGVAFASDKVNITADILKELKKKK